MARSAQSVRKTDLSEPKSVSHAENSSSILSTDAVSVGSLVPVVTMVSTACSSCSTAVSSATMSAGFLPSPPLSMSPCWRTACRNSSTHHVTRKGSSALTSSSNSNA